MTSSKANSLVPENEVVIPCKGPGSRNLALALFALSPLWLLGGLIIFNLGLSLASTALVSSIFLGLIGLGCVSSFIYLSACLVNNQILLNDRGIRLPRLMVPWPAQNEFAWQEVRRVLRTTDNYGAEKKLVVEFADKTELPIATGHLTPANELVLFRAIQDRLMVRQENRLPANPEPSASSPSVSSEGKGDYDGSQVISMDSRLVLQQQALIGKKKPAGLISHVLRRPALSTAIVTPILTAYFCVAMNLLSVQLTAASSAFLVQFLSLALPVVLAFLLVPGLQMLSQKRKPLPGERDGAAQKANAGGMQADLLALSQPADTTAQSNGASNEPSSLVRGQSYTQLWMQSLDPGLVPEDGTNRKPPPIVKSKDFRGQSYTELWLQALGVDDDKEDKEPDQEPADTSVGEGSKIRHYEIQFEIIRATPGSSFLVTSAGTKGMQVLKRFELKSEEEVDQFRDYGERLREMSHPGIVRLYDHFTEANVGYLVHEYVDGFSLRKQVKQLGPVDERLVVNLAMQMADILAYMHNQSPPIVHLDFSPDNFQLRRGSNLKLVDLSIPQWLCARTERHRRLLPYTPKEKAAGRPSMRSNIYMIGASLYFLSTGREPKPPGPFHPKAINDRLNGDLDELVAKCTVENEGGRFADADDLKSSKSLARLFHLLTG